LENPDHDHHDCRFRIGYSAKHDAAARCAAIGPTRAIRSCPGAPAAIGHGWDLSARDGLCYPNGYLLPQDQSARQYQYQRSYRGGRYPVPCGNGADVDIRDGLCYPNGTVPLQFQQGRQRYYGGDGYYERRPQRRYYYPE